MIYTEEDLKQAYTIGYNEAVDDVNAYIDQDSMEFSLDESYDEDYSAVEDAIMNETSSANKRAHTMAIIRRKREIDNKYKDDRYAPTEKEMNDKAHINNAIKRREDTNSRPRYSQSNLHVKDTFDYHPTARQMEIKRKIDEMKARKAGLANRGRR